MEEAVDYSAVVTQLQIENELLRQHMKTFIEARDAVYKIPDLVTTFYQKINANKYQLMVGLTILYCVLSIVFLLYDRFKG